MADRILALDIGGTKIAAGLVDADGTLVREWRKVRVPGHVEAVLEAARTPLKG